jgi:hypothetical protein
MLQHFSDPRKFYSPSDWENGFPRAKSPGAPGSESLFLALHLCVFAGDIPSFGCGSVALDSLQLNFPFTHGSGVSNHCVRGARNSRRALSRKLKSLI